MVPPSASSNLPRRIAAAPVNAPFSWPNSSLSMSSVGMAAQLTLTNGPDATGLSRWMCAASSSLPVPDSPESNTATSERATCVACCTACWNAALVPIIRGASPTSSRKRWFSRSSSARCERVLHDQQHAVAGERLLEKVERAIAGGLDGVADGAVPGDHHRRRRVVRLFQRSQHVDAVAVGQPDVEQVQVGACPASLGLELRRRVADGDAETLALEDQPQRQADVRLVVQDHDVVTAGHDAHSATTAGIGAAQSDAKRRAAQLTVEA